MGIDLVRHLVMDYVGMNNWEHVHSFSSVCKLWRVSCLPHLSKIGITKMDGGENRKLDVDGFLRYLQFEKSSTCSASLFPVEEQRVCLLKISGECAPVYGKLCISNG